jgi:glutathione S-transferase
MLKLFYSSVSPYARKVRVLVSEKGIESRIALLSCLPFERPVDLVAVNPLSKVPCLVLEDGTALYDSPFICEYLDQLSAPELVPASGRARWLTRISHRVRRIGAPNQRKLFCENDFLMIRGEPRCRQSVSWICLDLKPSKAAR